MSDYCKLTEKRKYEASVFFCISVLLAAVRYEWAHNGPGDKR